MRGHAEATRLDTVPELMAHDWGIGSRGAIHQLLNIILKLRILVLLPLSTLPYVVKVKNYS
jgi:hypothetical protein